MAAEHQPEEQKTTKQKSGFFSDFLDLLEVAVTTFFIFMMISFYVIRPVTVEGTSMVPTLHNGDKVLVSDLFYEPARGDIVVFKKDSYDDNKALVKRVIATAGQEVNIDTEAGTVAVDGVQLAESYIADLTKREDGAFHYPFTVPEGYIFVMGDNRMASTDSRNPAIALVPKEQVLGTVLFRYKRNSEQCSSWTDRFGWLF